MNCRALPVCCQAKKTVLLLRHHRPLDSKVQKKNMLLMLLSFPVRTVAGGRMASFSPAACTRAIYHLDGPFTTAKGFTISLSLVTHHKRHVMCRDITALSNSTNGLKRQREIRRRLAPPWAGQVWLRWVDGVPKIKGESQSLKAKPCCSA